MMKLIQGDCYMIKDIKEKNIVIVTDPPFNIGYKYRTYKDNKKEQEYFEWLTDLFGDSPLVCVHYPEQLHKLSYYMNRFPTKICSWVYNSNTGKQHRDVAYYGIKPDFRLVKQPYKNPNDKRIKKLIQEGKGARLYDWWNVNQVKNTSKEKTEHPCQMPEIVMEYIIGVIPNKEEITVVDPFMGSGTTGVACKKKNVNFIGIENDEFYFEIAKKRIYEHE